MKTDTEIRNEAIEVLINHIGLLETERFIMLIQREPFDYTEWRKNLPADKTVRELSKEAMELRRRKKK